MHKVRILHLDDQPEHASWIPREINNWFWKCFRKDMAATRGMEENDEETRFLLHVKILEDEFSLEYQIFEDKDPLVAAAKEADSGHIALIVLDQAIKSDFSAGGLAFNEIEKISKHFTERMIVLTAYPAATCSQLLWSVDDPRLVAKPPETRKIIKRFVSGLSGAVSHATMSALKTGVANEE